MIYLVLRLSFRESFSCENQSILKTMYALTNSYSFGRIPGTQTTLVISVKIPKTYVSSHLLLFYFIKIY